MKYLLIIIILLISPISAAETTPYSKLLIFTKWHHQEVFAKVLSNIPSNQYPVIIEAGALVGDGVVYRVLYNEKPESKLLYEYVYGVSNDKFSTKNAMLRKQGYILTHHQILQGMAGKLHQAIWVSDGLSQLN